MKRTISLLSCLLFITMAFAKPKMVSVSVIPAEAAIYINGTLMGYGYAEFPRPKKNGVVVIRCECSEYNTLNTKYYGTDKRANISFSLQQDGFYRASAASGIVNKYFTITIDSLYYNITADNKIDVTPAWKLLHQILLNYFEEIETTDFHGGYVQTAWQYKTFNLTEKQIRNRVTIRDISTPEKVAFQIKISSEVAGEQAARHGEFEEIDRIPKEFEEIVQELQTRVGKAHN